MQLNLSLVGRVETFTVYLITNLDNDKIYVGVHCHHVNETMKYYMGSSKYLAYDIGVHGVDNFSKIILFAFDNEDEMLLKEREIVNHEFISRCDTYNKRLGGSGYNAKGMTTVIKADRTGKRFFLSTSDPLYVNGTYISIWKGICGPAHPSFGMKRSPLGCINIREAILNRSEEAKLKTAELIRISQLNRITIHNKALDIEKHIKPEELESYLSKFYEIGMLHPEVCCADDVKREKLSAAHRNTIYFHKGTENKRIKENDLEGIAKLKADGFTPGKVDGLILIRSEDLTDSIYVLPEEFESEFKFKNYHIVNPKVVDRLYIPTKEEETDFIKRQCVIYWLYSVLELKEKVKRSKKSDRPNKNGGKLCMHHPDTKHDIRVLPEEVEKNKLLGYVIGRSATGMEGFKKIHNVETKQTYTVSPENYLIMIQDPMYAHGRGYNIPGHH